MRMSETSTAGGSSPGLSSRGNSSVAEGKLWKGICSRASAFSSTQRMARSSSTIQTVFMVWPVNKLPTSMQRACHLGYSALQRQPDDERGAPGAGLAFDRAVVLVDEVLRQREAEPGTAFAARDQRVEHPL